jgi:hypothetical protein
MFSTSVNARNFAIAGGDGRHSGDHREDASLGNQNGPPGGLSEAQRLSRIQDCLRLIKVLPKCNSLEKLVHEWGFTLESARILNHSFMDVERKDLEVGQIIFVPGWVPPPETTVQQIMLGVIDSVGIKIQSFNEDGSITGVCWGAGGTGIDRCWLQDEQVSVPLDIDTFKVPMMPQGIFVCPIGKKSNYSTPEGVKRSKERGEREEREEKRRKRHRNRESSSSESESEEERKTLNGFFIRCADNVKRVVMTKTGADARVMEVQGLLRIWSPETVEIYLRDLALDFGMIRRAASSGHPGASLSDDYLEAELQMFKKLSSINDLPCVKSDVILRKTVMGSWDLTKPDRLTLSDFLASKHEGWAITADPLSKVMFFEAAKNLQLTIGAVWGKAFHVALEPVFELQYENKQQVHYHPAAYIVAQLERALHRFHISIFAERSTGKHAVLRRTSQGCADILKSLVVEAMNFKSWESFRCDMFFAPGGDYELYCKKASKTSERSTKSVKDSKAKKSSASAGKKEGTAGKTQAYLARTAAPSTKEPRTVICVNKLADMFGPKGTPPCGNKPCPYIHYRKTIFETPKADVLALLRGHKGLKNADAIIKRVEAEKSFSA